MAGQSKPKRMTRAERQKAARARMKARRERAYTRASERAAALAADGKLAPRERMRLFLRAHFPHMGAAKREALANQFAGAEPEPPAGAPVPAVTLDTEVDA